MCVWWTTAHKTEAHARTTTRGHIGRLSAVNLTAIGPEAAKLHRSGRRYFKLDISNADSVDDLSADAPAGSVRLATPLSMYV